MIPPQVNGATYWVTMTLMVRVGFPMIPPQVNGATLIEKQLAKAGFWFPMIPPQVNGATTNLTKPWSSSWVTSFQ